jgi:hypothetical protein
MIALDTINIMEFYEELGFEEIEIEDGLTALFFEIDPEGSYVLLTDDDGDVPQSLKQPLVLACYTAEGAFEWSATFKSSPVFKEIWTVAPAPAEKLAAVQKYRESKQIFK